MYPVIFVHGFLGYGDGDGMNKVFPGFGALHGDTTRLFNSWGVPAYGPSLGGFSGLWDRCCELYAYIKGGTVDYGKVHAARNGHARFGATYPGVYPEWGTAAAPHTDTADSVASTGEVPINKIHLVGHSFGGPTVDTFLQLLAFGSAEEREGTDPSDLSPLFSGNKGDWVFSATTMAPSFNGEDAAALAEAHPLVKPVMFGLLSAANLISGTIIAKVYDFHLARFGFTSRDRFLWYKPRDILHYLRLKEDNICYEESMDGFLELVKDYQLLPDVYYFMYRGYWCHDAGLTPFPNLPDAYPYNQPHKVLAVDDPAMNEYVCETTSLADVKPGIWYTVPNSFATHTAYMGMGVDKSTYESFYRGIYERLKLLEGKS